MYEFCLWVVKGNSIVIPPLTGSPGNTFQLSAVLLHAPTNNKIGNVVNVAGGGSVGVFVLDGGKEEAKVLLWVCRGGGERLPQGFTKKSWRI